MYPRAFALAAPSASPQVKPSLTLRSQTKQASLIHESGPGAAHPHTENLLCGFVTWVSSPSEPPGACLQGALPRAWCTYSPGGLFVELMLLGPGVTTPGRRLVHGTVGGPEDAPANSPIHSGPTQVSVLSTPTRLGYVQRDPPPSAPTVGIPQALGLPELRAGSPKQTTPSQWPRSVAWPSVGTPSSTCTERQLPPLSILGGGKPPPR